MKKTARSFSVIMLVLLAFLLVACNGADDYAVPKNREVESVNLYIASSGKSIPLEGEDFDGVVAGLRRSPKLIPSVEEGNTSPSAYDYTLDVKLKKTNTKAAFTYRVYIGVYSATAFTGDGEVSAGKTVLRRGEYVGTADEELVKLLASIVYRETGEM